MNGAGRVKVSRFTGPDLLKFNWNIFSKLQIFLGAKVNAKDSRWLTPLHRACASGNEVIFWFSSYSLILQASYMLKFINKNPVPICEIYPEFTMKAPGRCYYEFLVYLAVD